MNTTIRFPSFFSYGTLSFNILGEKDLRDICEWHNDLETQKNTCTENRKTISDLIEWYRADYSRHPQEIVYIITDETKNIGYATVKKESKDITELGIVIGPSFRKKRYAFNALKCLCHKTFELGTRKIKARIISYNKAAISLVEQVGFKFEGCLRQELLKNGQYVDLTVYSLFKDFFYENMDAPKL